MHLCKSCLAFRMCDQQGGELRLCWKCSFWHMETFRFFTMQICLFHLFLEGFGVLCINITMTGVYGICHCVLYTYWRTLVKKEQFIAARTSLVFYYWYVTCGKKKISISQKGKGSSKWNPFELTVNERSLKK